MKPEKKRKNSRINELPKSPRYKIFSNISKNSVQGAPIVNLNKDLGPVMAKNTKQQHS